MSEWKEKYLHEIVDIRVSNVDKKIYPNKSLVGLCNYMDVYSNDYISNKLSFTTGSADVNEIQKFGLKVDDVIITKDSETPEDIAVSAVVIEDLENVVCGYHLAILRSDKNELDGKYLMLKLKSEELKNYFLSVAKGSTRFGLTIGDIENAKIKFPSISDQKSISKILSTADAVIEKTQATIAKYKVIKQGMLQDLFTRGIDITTNKLRPRFEDAPQLYRESKLGMIPREWEVDIMDVYVGFLRSGLSRLLSEEDIGIPVMISGNIQESRFDFSNLKYWYLDDPQGADTRAYKLTIGDILICFINSLDQIGKSAIFEGFKRDVIYTTNLLRMQATKDTNSRFLFYLLNSSIIQNELHTIVKPAVNQASFTTKDFLN